MKNVEKKDLYFPSANGSQQIHVLVYLPAEDIKGYVQIVHDTYEHIGIYEDVLKSFAYRGYLAFGHDHMGHGKSVHSQEELGKLMGDNGFRNLMTDTNTAFVYVFNEYPPKEVQKYKRTVIEKKGLGSSRKEVELTKPPLHVLIGVGFGSAVVKNYTVIYEDVNCVCLCGDKGYPFSGGIALQRCKAQLKLQGKDASAEKLALSLEKKYLGGKDASYRFAWKSSTSSEIFEEDPLCNFEYDLGYLKAILETENSLGLSEWVKSYPQFLATYIVSGADDPVSENGREVHVMLKYFQQMKMKNIFFKIYEGYHNLFFENCRTELINNIVLLMNAVDKQQYGTIVEN